VEMTLLREEKEKILNTVINSVQFDSIYSAKRVYFGTNELLSKSTPLTLKKGKCKVKVLERSELKQKRKEYVSIGDFTMPKENLWNWCCTQSLCAA